MTSHDDAVEQLALALVTQILARRRNSSVEKAGVVPDSAHLVPREIFTCGALKVDPRGRRVECEGRRVDLTFMEFELLVCLARSPGVPVHKETLRSSLWGGTIAAGSRSIDQHVHEIRRKLGDTPETQTYIRTVRKVGYLVEGEWTQDC